MNKFEKFAEAMSEKLYQIKGKDLNNTMIIIDDDRQIPVDFITKILNNDIHCEQIKSLLRMSVLKDVTEFPNKYVQRNNEQGDTVISEYVYSYDVYKHSYLIDAYIEDQFHRDHPVMENVHVCDFCGSDNVQTKAWVRPNNNNEYVDIASEEINDNYCDDCNQNTTLSVVEKNVRYEVIGFQVWGDDGIAEADKPHPHMKNEKSIYSLDQANSMMDDDNNGDEQWQLLTIWTNDVKEPVLMFEGDPREPEKCTPSDGTKS